MIGVYCPPDNDRYSSVIRGELPGEDVRVFSSPEDLTEHGRSVEALLLDWQMPAEPLAGLGHLILIQAASAGVEGLETKHIPPGVRIARVVDLFSAGVADYVFAHLLARTQNVMAFAEAQRDRVWRKVKIHTTLADRRLGVAGLGSIGSRIVRVGHAFGMRVHGYSRTEAAAQGLPLASHRQAEPGALAAFAGGVDVLVLALPLTAATRHAVDAGVLSALGPQATLVNVGRGALVDERALIDALTARALGGAILDVFEEEPLPAESPLWSLPTVTITPHIAGTDQHEGAARLFADNVRRLRAGQPLRGEVDRTRGY